MLVQAVDRERWERARERAQSRPSAYRSRITSERIHHDLRSLAVVSIESGTTGGQYYSVVVTCGPEGVGVTCNCQAGQHERACWHAASALLALDLYPALD